MLAPKLTINRQEKERTLDPKEAVKDEYLEEFHTVVWEIQCRGIYWFTLKYIGWFNVKEFKELFFVLIKYHLFLVVSCREFNEFIKRHPISGCGIINRTTLHNNHPFHINSNI